MIINIANEALIYTAFCSWPEQTLPSNTCLLNAVSHREICWLGYGKITADTCKAFVCLPLYVWTLT